MKQPLQPLGALRSYQAMLLAYVADMTRETREALPQLEQYEVGTAAWSERLTLLMAALALWHSNHVGRVLNRLGNVFDSVNKFNDKDWQEIVRSGTRLKIGPSSASPLPPAPIPVGGVPRPSGSAAPTILGGPRPPGPPPFSPRVITGDMSSPFEISSRLGYRVDVYRSEPWLADLQANWVARNAALIKTIPQQYMAQVEMLIREAALKGLQPSELKKQIMDLTGISERRAKVIARDQMAKANAELTQYRQEDLGITEYTWLTSRDERVRGTPGGRYASARPSHFARAEKRFSWSKPPEGGHPGMAIMCVPPESEIKITNGVKKLFRRRSADNVASLVTASGKTIEATFNHPVLTNRGWIAIDEVNVGDYLVNTGDQAFDGVINDVERSPSKIGEVFNSISCYVTPNSCTASEFQFHGDITDGEIETIDIHGFLPLEIYSSMPKGFAELFFANADMVFIGSEFGIDSSLEKAISALWPASIESVRGCCKLLSVLNGHSGHSQEVCLATISNFNSLLDETASNYVPRDSKFIGDFKLALTGEIFFNNLINGKILAILWSEFSSRNNEARGAQSLGESVRADFEMSASGSKTVASAQKYDCVVKKGVREFVGHYVYNLESNSNWYSCNDLIIHNCRCVALPIFPGE